MATLILKYGGTSLGTPDRIKSVALKIAELKKMEHNLVVVVSAMGHSTDELIELASKVTSNYQKSEFEREMDVLLSTGERISMALLSLALLDHGIRSISFTGSQAGIITNESHTRARIMEIKPIRVLEELENGKVVIIAGFQGVSRKKEITTLGRGGSDTTAVALACVLKKSDVECRVFTDVEGIYSADPRIVTQAKKITEIESSTVLEMAALGAQVMHPRAIELIRKENIKCFVGHSITGEGTMITEKRHGAKVSQLEEPEIAAIVKKDHLVKFEFSELEFSEALKDASDMNIQIHDHGFSESKGGFIYIEKSETSSFFSRFSKNIIHNNVSAVSCVGTHILQSAKVTSQAMQLFKSENLKVLDLTTHTQSITLYLENLKGNEVAIRAVQLLHNLLIKNS